MTPSEPTPSTPEYCAIATTDAVKAAVKAAEDQHLTDAIAANDQEAAKAAVIKSKNPYGANGVAAALKALGTSKQKAFKAAVDSGDLQAAAKIVAGPFGINTDKLSTKQLDKLKAGWDIFQKQQADIAAAYSPVGPTLSPGHVRLYRGLPDDQTQLTNDFTNLYNIAKSYGDKSPTGKVMYADIPKSDLASLNPVPIGGSNMKYFLTPEHMANVKELTPELLSQAEKEAPGITEEEVAAKHEKPTFNDIDWDLIKDMVNAPPDVKAKILNHAFANIGGGIAGGIYGATQDPNDDLPTKIAKTLLYGTAGEIAGHVIAGGPVREAPSRFTQTYINNLLTTGSISVKAANDIVAMTTGPILRGIDAALNGRTTAPAEVIKAYFGGFAGVKEGLRQLIKEMNPSFIAGNDPLEAGFLKQSDNLASLAAKAQSGDEAATKELQRIMTGSHSLPSVGQYAGSLTTRVLRGVTEFAREILRAQEAAANTLAEEKGYKALPNIDDRVDRALLLNKPTGLVSGTMYELSRAFNNTPLSNIAKALIPFRLVPANMLGRVFEYIPVAGLLEAPGNDAKLLAAKQIMGIAALSAAYMTVGRDINGFGPTDSTQRTNWLAEGNRPWSVKIGDNYYAMRQMPPIVQAPLRVLGALEDFKRYNHDSLSEDIVKEFGSSVGDHEFFPAWLDLLEKSTSTEGLSFSDLSLQKEAATQAGSIVPAFMSEYAHATQPNTPDTLAKGSTFGQMVQDAISARTPGFAQNVPSRIGPGGQPIPSGSSGVGSLLGSYAPIPDRNDKVAQMFSAAGVATPYAPKSITLGGVPIDMQPDEARLYQQVMGNVLSAVAPSLTVALTKLPPEARQQIISQIEAEAHQAAFAQVLSHMAQSGSLATRLQAARQQSQINSTNRILPAQNL